MYTIDNTDRGDIERTILWQYDNATNLIAIINIFKDFFKYAITDFWDDFITKHTDLFADDENISDYGLALWGKAIGVPRLTYKDGDEVKYLNSALYRSVLKARLILSTKSATLKDYADFITAIFGENKVTVIDTGKMSLSVVKNDGVTLTTDEQVLVDNVDAWFLYPAGVKSDVHSNSNMFGFYGQQLNTTATDPIVGGLDDSSFNWRLTPGGNWND